MKSFLTRIIAFLPFSELSYSLLQKKFGRLQSDPFSRLKSLDQSIQYLESTGYDLENKVVFEIGSGHELISPLGWILNGASSVITVDLNLRLDRKVFEGSLNQLTKSDIEMLHQTYFSRIKLSRLREFLHTIEESKNLEEVTHNLNIDYRAPSNATRTNLEKSSIDIHFSNTTLEHIERESIQKIFEEATRILAKDGVLLHRIDMSDHYSQTDKSITSINFLRYSNTKWKRIAGNSFAYCNRLRFSEYIEIIIANGFEILKVSNEVDHRALNALRSGFRIDKSFAKFSDEDIATSGATIIARKLAD